MLYCRRSFPEGTNPHIYPMTHLWEPLRVMPKPLVVPLCSEGAGLLTRFLLQRQVLPSAMCRWKCKRETPFELQ